MGIQYDYSAILNYGQVPPTAPPLEEGILDDVAPAPLYPTYPLVDPTPAGDVPPPSFDTTSFMVPPKPLLTKAIHDKTLGLLGKAYDISYPLLDRKTTSSTATYTALPLPPLTSVPKISLAPIYVDLSDRSWNMFNTTNNVDNKSEKTGEKKDFGLRILVGIVSFVAIVASAYFVGKSVAEGEEVQEETSTVDDLKNAWNLNKNCYDTTYQGIVDRIIKRVGNILERDQTNRVHKIALLVIVFAAGGAAFAGALLGSTAWMTAGVALGALAAVGCAFKLGYAYFSKAAKKDAEAIDQALTELNQQPNLLIYV